MAADTWPTTNNMPQSFMYQGYSQRHQSDVIRSPMGYGPAKTRRRTTAAIDVVTASLILTTAQKSDLVTFYETTLTSGSERFNHVDPLNGGTVEMRFTAPIQWSRRGPGAWLAVMNIEILP